MSNFEDLPISGAHRKALEAGRKLFEEKGALKRVPNTPDILKSDSGCSVYLDAANGAYAAAAEAAFSGSEAEWVAAMAEGALWNHAYNTCLSTTLYTLKEVFG